MKKTFSSRTLIAAALIALTFACCGAAFAQYAENVLHTFNASTGGNYINPPLVSDGAGNLYGTTFRGGATDNGTFFELTPTAKHGWQQTVLYSFPYAEGIDAATFPQGGLTRDSEGNFYGFSPYDGTGVCSDIYGDQEGCGIIWKLTLTSTGWKRSILYDFTGAADGGGPFSLVMDSAGNLYGLTSDTGYGSVFELARNGTKWTFSTLYTFTGGADGASPSTIILDKSGDLLGTAYSGGAGNCDGFTCGVVFEVSPVSGGGWKESTLYSFLGGTDGGTPYGGIALDASGNIFGVAGSSGIGGNVNGEIFELSQASGVWTESVPYNFPNPAGPVGMASDASGHLYGTTYYGGLLTLCENGCGTIFSFSPISGGWSYQTIYSFTGTFDGKIPAAAPSIPDASGDLYVATQGFVAINYTAPEEMWFKLSPASGGQWKGTVVADVPTSKDGYDPMAPLLLDPNYQTISYGTTLGGGSAGWGTVFVMYNNGGSGLKPVIIYNFLFAGDGGLPYGGLATDAAGNLYGTAAYGGALDCPEGCGTVFKLSPGSDLNNWNFSTLYSFKNEADGRTPLGAAAIDAAGNVYATSSYGGGPNCGPYGCGAVIEVPAAGGSARIVHAFQGGSDGGSPYLNSVAVDTAGDIYGVNTAGGTNGTGVVYRLSRGSGDTWKETVLYNFLPTDTYNVFTPALDSAGNVYGTTRLGGVNNLGTVIELSRSGNVWTSKTLYNFTSSDGGFPAGGVVFDSKGNLFGLTQSKAYELSLVSGGWQETLLTAFNPASSGTLNGSLVVDSSGDLFGTTSVWEGDGPLVPGTVFELTP
jgi:uncharacterized repeat protein (TIGR03803 family)